MPPKNKDGGGGEDVEVVVDIGAIRKFGGFLIDEAARISDQLNALDTIVPAAGNTNLFNGARSMNGAITTRRNDLKSVLVGMRTELETLGDDMALVADMYERAEDDAKAEAEGLLPIIAPGAAPAAPPPPPPPPAT